MKFDVELRVVYLFKYCVILIAVSIRLKLAADDAIIYSR
jgi:hypothetical protein